MIIHYYKCINGEWMITMQNDDKATGVCVAWPTPSGRMFNACKKVKKLDCHLHDHLFLTSVLHLFFNIII